MSDAKERFEKAWSELSAPANETVTSKWYFKKGYEAATKAAATSRVVEWPTDFNEFVLSGLFDEQVFKLRFYTLNPHLVDAEKKGE